jgi:hypothetical protein
VDSGCNRSDPADSLKTSRPGVSGHKISEKSHENIAQDCAQVAPASSLGWPILDASRSCLALSQWALGGRLFAQQHSQHDRRRIFCKAPQRFASRWPLRLLRDVVIRPALVIVAHNAIPIRDPIEQCISQFDFASRQP